MLVAEQYLTWQDPVAIGLGVAGLALVSWLRRRGRAKPQVKRVPAEELSLSRRNKG